MAAAVGDDTQHLRLRALNHISLVVSDVPKSMEFWTRVCGFVPIKRPSQFDFDGAWLWRHGLAIHLIEGRPLSRSPTINPRADHISFVAEEPLEAVAARLQKLGVQYKAAEVLEGFVLVRQLFFLAPDNVTIEICNCDTLPICPLEGEQDTHRCLSCALEMKRLANIGVGGTRSDEDSPASSEMGFF